MTSKPSEGIELEPTEQHFIDHVFKPWDGKIMPLEDAAHYEFSRGPEVSEAGDVEITNELRNTLKKEGSVVVDSLVRKGLFEVVAGGGLKQTGDLPYSDVAA